MSIGTTNVEVLTMEYSMRIEWHGNYTSQNSVLKV